MQLIASIIPTHLVTNAHLSVICPFIESEKNISNFQQVGGLVTKNSSFFCLIRVMLYFKGMQNSTIINEFSNILFLCVS